MPGLSPRTQQFMQPPPSPEDATRAFEDGFSQMAQNVLAGKFPELVESVVTFKVLASDIDNGSGVGAFIISLNGEALYIPIVMTNSQIKPLEIVYYKEKDIFLPLDPEWLDEISRNALDELGEGIKPPEELEPDVNIRDIVIPPTVGRHVYASAYMPGEKLAQFLTEAPNRVKKAFKQVLESNHKILKYAFEQFDRKMLLDALRPHQEKTAAAPELATVLTPDDSAEKFLKFFGKEAGTAWQEAVKKGYVIQDKRRRTNLAIETQEPIVRTTAQESGFYRLHMRDGSVSMALVISEPQEFVSPMYAGKRTDMRRAPSEYWKRHKKTQNTVLVDENMSPVEPSHKLKPQRFLIYFENGDITTTTEPPVGRWVPAEEVKGPLAKLLDGEAKPATQGYGFFVCFRGGKVRGTMPTDILSVTTGSDGVRRMKTDDRVLVTDPEDPIGQIVAPRDGNVTYVPRMFKFVKGTYAPATHLQGADDTLGYCQELEKQGALQVKIKDAGASMFSIGGLEPQTKVATLRTLLTDMELPGKEIADLLEKTAERGSYTFYLVNPEQFTKFAGWAKQAQGPAPMAPPPGAGGMPPEGMPPEMAGGMPPEMAGMPPEMAGMPPEMAGMPSEGMMPPEPPPPSPVELAAAEVEADLAQQSADFSEQIAEQQRDVANQMSAIAAVKQRAEQIAMEQAGGPPAGPPGTVPQEPPPGAMPPEMAGGMPPEAGGMPPGGMPPEMAGAMPPEMAGGMPPGAGGMPMEGPMSAEQLAGQAGPMMEEAAGMPPGMEGAEAFEATAIGSMATDADLREAVSSYLPNLEKALDNLGRILLTLWIKEDELRSDIGEEDFADLEKRLQTVFGNLGSLILRINQTAMTSPEISEGDEETQP